MNTKHAAAVVAGMLSVEANRKQSPQFRNTHPVARAYEEKQINERCAALALALAALKAEEFRERLHAQGVTPEQRADFAAAHAEGLHAEAPREFCPDCEGL